MVWWGFLRGSEHTEFIDTLCFEERVLLLKLWREEMRIPTIICFVT